MTTQLDALLDVASQAAQHLPKKLITPGERLFWLYLLGAGVVACVFWAKQRSRDGSSFLHWLAPPRFWRQRSVHTDMWLALSWGGIRAVLGGLLVTGPALLSSLGAVLWLVAAMDAWFGVSSSTIDLGWAMPWVYGFALFVAWDLCRYTLHRLLHDVSWLWRFHQVHHSATVLTPLTLHRSHPIEAILFATSQWVVTVLMTAVAVRLAGAQVVPVEVLGVNAFGFALSLLGGNLRHSHAAIAYPQWLERWLISPAQHQLHHSVDSALQRSNYGVWLACWDRIAGSLHHGHADQQVVFGVADEDLNHDPSNVLSALRLGGGRRGG